MNTGGFMFGCGSGRITKKEIAIRHRVAKKNGIAFVWVTGRDGHCECGWGCQYGQCDYKHWWFEAPNRGEPFDSQLGSQVIREIQALGGMRT